LLELLFLGAFLYYLFYMALADTKLNELLGEYVARMPEISDTAKYWFVRTEAGSLFEPFITSQCIAIGHASVSLATLVKMPLNDASRKALKKQIQINEPVEKRSGLAASQLLKFAHEMKQGDFVIIPSPGSSELAIGVITARPPYERQFSYQGTVIPGFAKRRGVQYIKRINRESVNPNLYRILYSHQAITDVSSCAHWIDTLIFDFFRKGKKFHYVLQINRADGVNARDLFGAGLDLLTLADEFAESIGLGEDSHNIETRINLNSPGDAELYTTAARYIFIVAALVVGLNGGGLKFKFEKAGINVDISTDGLIKALNKFLNDKKNRELTESAKKKLDAMQVSDPKVLVNILEQIHKNKK
jgi:restriction system protein